MTYLSVRTKYYIILSALMCVMACNPQSSDFDRPVTLVPVQLAVRVGSGVDASTKAYPAVIKEINQEFRGITDITILPFDKLGTIEADDVSNFHPSYLPDIDKEFYSAAIVDGSYVTGLVYDNNAHLWSSADANLPGGTGSVLVYGHPPYPSGLSGTVLSQRNGSLVADGLGPKSYKRAANEISFSHTPIYTQETLPSETDQIAEIMTSIVSGISSTVSFYWYKEYETAADAREESVAVRWDESIGDARLKDFFLQITNGGNLTTCSGTNVEYMLTGLYKQLLSYTSQSTIPFKHTVSGVSYATYSDRACTSPLTWGDVYNGLRDMILARFNVRMNEHMISIGADNSVAFENQNLSVYPSSYGLPEGCAVMRWTSLGYKAASVTMDGLAPVTTFCYPPSLWFFANSTLRTSSTEREDDYVRANTSWKTILSKYTTGSVVRSYTKSVAIKDSLQFSCAKLTARVFSPSSTLDDAEGSVSSRVTLTDTSFPVTGIIVGSQHNLNFDFTPASGGEMALYDTCIDGVTVKRYSESNVSSAPSFSTLVSQTPDGENVYFCLELRNDCGKSFTGADGVVLPGAKFYFVGLIELQGDLPSVFVRDYVTTINCMILSLAGARTAVPDMIRPQLSVGMEVSTTWAQSDAVTVILY